MALDPFPSSICKCLESGSQGILDAMTGRINKILREKTRLNNLLKRAPAFNLTPPNLNLTLGKVLDFEKGLEDLTGGGFPFPGGGDISLGDLTKCLQVQIDLELKLNLGLDLSGLIPSFCDLGKFTDLLQNAVDDLLPKIDAQVGFGCDPGAVATLNTTLSNALGSVSADPLTGTVGVESLTADSAAAVGQGYLDDFNMAVNCCLNIEKIKDTVQNFITDPLSGEPFNRVNFEAGIFGDAKLGGESLIESFSPIDPNKLVVKKETLLYDVIGLPNPLDLTPEQIVEGGLDLL